MSGDRILTDEPADARVIPALIVIVQARRNTVGFACVPVCLRARGRVVLAKWLVCVGEEYGLGCRCNETGTAESVLVIIGYRRVSALTTIDLCNPKSCGIDVVVRRQGWILVG